ncbi:SDR family oxidoreductase [Nocardioides sp.]|uniref:SDR family oxidoreductase n=1 Tax=Nocardioides sp. TaxID=35761 RepID=UPI00271F2051|nr:SDR family oxidoreductase [Nocardioides sp.]MDO9457485.1 SDR family oxidoreductase [Nocardioides sp.]
MGVRRFRSLDGVKVFVTGAASGIGRAVAEQAAAEGAVLHLTDVQAGPLAEVAGRLGAAYAEPVDLTDHDAVVAATDRLTAGRGPMDVVLNVAGISTWGTVSSLEHDDWRRLVEVNLMGPIHVIERLVPPMVDAGRGGHLVNVSSAAGVIGMPWHAAYSASKFGLRGVSEVLRFDLRPHGIGVSLVVPGGVATPLTNTVRIAGVNKESPAFRRAHAGFRRRAVTPEQAASAIWDGVRRNRYWVYTSPDVRAIHAVQRHVPLAYTLAMRAMNRAANRALPDVERARRVGP